MFGPPSAALLVAPEAVFRDGHADREVWLDAWWTQVVYHGSLKGVGISHNAFSTDVREYCQQYMQELQVLHSKGEPESGGGVVTRTSARIAQLTSLSNAEDNVLTFSRLEKCRNDTGYLDAVLAINPANNYIQTGSDMI